MLHRQGYLFGGRSGVRQFVAASVLDRLVLMPAVLSQWPACFLTCDDVRDLDDFAAAGTGFTMRTNAYDLPSLLSRTNPQTIEGLPLGLGIEKKQGETE